MLDALCSLLLNPVASKKHYRAYVIHKLPHLRVLDFQKIKLRVGWQNSVVDLLYFTFVSL